MILLRPFGVYRPQADTWLLGEALRQAGIRPGADVLDIGCGTGAVSILAATTRPRSQTAMDCSRRAVWTTRVNAALRGVRVRVEWGDALELAAGRRFDVVLANPPYVPGVPAVPTRGRSRAWDAGADGRAMLDRLCVLAPCVLAPDGVLLLVQSALSGVDTTLRQLRGGGLKATVVGRAEVPFGPVMRGREKLLRDQGLLDPEQRYEELVVIRADRLRVPPTG